MIYRRLTGIIDKEWRLHVLLFVLSAFLFYFYYQELIHNINSVLFSSGGDALKNYYTFVFHTKHDMEALVFSGMNYPYGEHIVYTDCQPLLSLILRCLPFTHHHLVGILHGLILLSFIITPLVLMTLLRKLGLNRSSAFISALAIAVLSPQIQRFGGHFALAYGCVIPLVVLFLLNYMAKPGFKNLVLIFNYNFLLFFIHPYFGFGTSLFSFASLVLYDLLTRKRPSMQGFLKVFVMGLLPVLLFKLFMVLSDLHDDRPTEPYGLNLMTANIESVFTPVTGPFKHFLQQIVKVRGMEWEGYSYIGIFTFFLLVVYVILSVIYYRRLNLNRQLLALMLAAAFLLLFSFGIHNMITDALNIEISFLKQFRALGRFAWYFYFLLPVFLLPSFFHLLSAVAKPSVFRILTIIVPLLFFGFNLTEAHSYFRMMTKNVFRERNVFNEAQLTGNERSVLAALRSQKFQALIPLPLFHTGSEFYTRNGNASAATAYIYSFHANLPIYSVMLSRTSITETERTLELLNIYKKDRPVFNDLEEAPFLIVRTDGPLRADESRIIGKLEPFAGYDSLSFFKADKKDFVASLDQSTGFTEPEELKEGKNQSILFLANASRKPFLPAIVRDSTVIVEIGSEQFSSGAYIVSLHYRFSEKSYRSGNNLVVMALQSGSVVEVNKFPVLQTSGFYNGFVVVEEYFDIREGYDYIIYLKGMSENNYAIRNFLISPANKDVNIKQDGQLLINNYPERESGGGVIW